MALGAGTDAATWADTDVAKRVKMEAARPDRRIEGIVNVDV